MAEINRRKWVDIPQFPRAHYEVDVTWDYVEWHLEKWERSRGVVLDPDYQREHVWTEVQQRAYVEYTLSGGEVGRNLTWNCRTWLDGGNDPIELVDGKQRLEAVRRFMRGELDVYGMRYEEGDVLRMRAGFKWRVCTLPTRAEVLQLYLNINAGGTPHTAEELDRVRALAGAERLALGHG